MIDRIKRILEAEGISVYLIYLEKKETSEAFFIKKNMDMRRAENVTTASVTVYRDFEKDGVAMRGHAGFNVEPANTDEEISAKCKRAFLAASFVNNKWYEIAVANETIGKSVANEADGDLMKKAILALYKEDKDEEAYINSAEVFVNSISVRIVNSNGVSVAYTKKEVKGEFVIQCPSPQDVETYQDFAFDDFTSESETALSNQVKLAISMTKDRAVAKDAPKAGEYDIILSDGYVATLFEYYLNRCSGGYIYQGYSDFKVNDFVQTEKKEDVKGDLLNISYEPSVPYSLEGIQMKKRACIEDGVFVQLHDECRYSSYLKVEPTGLYSKLSCKTGSVAFEDMKKRKGLYVVNFSDFQMDSLGGHFGGEIRLAYLNDGEKISVVTGGSINGSIISAAADLELSSDIQNTAQFVGPKAVLLKNISVAGE